MKEKLLNLKLPKLYKENLIELEEGLDIVPSLPEWISKGRQINQYKKMQLLVTIEGTKSMLNKYLKELSSEEIKQVNETIEKSILEYNEL